MGRWNAVSDYDYYDGNRVDGIERTCQECGEPLMVSRDEAYQIHVFHPDCLDAVRDRNARKMAKAYATEPVRKASA